MVAWNNTDLQECLCWSVRDNDWCNQDDDPCRDYTQSRYYLAVPAALGITFLALLMAVYVVMRVCGAAWCCAKSLATCSCAVCPAQGARVSTVRMYRGVWAAVCFALLVQCLYGMSHFNDFNDSFTATGRSFGTFGDNVQTVGKEWTEQARDLHRDLTNVATATTWQIESTSDDLHHKGKSLRGVRSTMQWTSDTVSGVMWLSMVLVSISAALLMCNLHYLVPTVSLFVLWVVGCVVFMLQVSLAAVDTVAADGCTDYAGVAQFTHNVTATQLGNASSMLAAADTTSADLEQLYLDTNCHASQTLGKGPLQRVCNVTFSCSPCTATVFGMGRVLNESRVVQGAVNASDLGVCGAACSITQCATQCREGSDLRMAAAAALSQLTYTQDTLVQLNTTLAPLRSGAMFADFTASLQQGMCTAYGGVSPAASPLARLTAAAGFTLCVAVVLAALGSYIYKGQVARDEVEPLTPPEHIRYCTFAPPAEDEYLPVKPITAAKPFDPELGVPEPVTGKVVTDDKTDIQ
eukprot:TRINITY_DN2039_c0_g1_i1.p1 TRINITY_DN2039_c0_g1~~TRINITY_DN2039_c0_g1_i1.p1  ORF type:complete len:546 (+),score=210.50 TRINITY_DN2039_c0_g1_i1:78-1640(+)